MQKYPVTHRTGNPVGQALRTHSLLCLDPSDPFLLPVLAQESSPWRSFLLLCQKPGASVLPQPVVKPTTMLVRRSYNSRVTSHLPDTPRGLPGQEKYLIRLRGASTCHGDWNRTGAQSMPVERLDPESVSLLHAWAGSPCMTKEWRRKVIHIIAEEHRAKAGMQPASRSGVMPSRLRFSP